jgi:DNA-binding MarR family transcriptional regulator
MLNEFNESNKALEPYCESFESIADELVISKRTIVKVINELESENLVRRIPIRIGKSTCNSYIVTKP